MNMTILSCFDLILLIDGFNKSMSSLMCFFVVSFLLGDRTVSVQFVGRKVPRILSISLERNNSKDYLWNCARAHHCFKYFIVFDETICQWAVQRNRTSQKSYDKMQSAISSCDNKLWVCNLSDKMWHYHFDKTLLRYGFCFLPFAISFQLR